MRKGLILVSLLGWMAAGCGGSSKSGGNGGGGGSAGGGGGTGGGTGVSTDMATLAQPDLLIPSDMTALSCAALADCVNNAANAAAQQACYNAGTTNAQNLFNAYQTCFSTECAASKISASSTDACLQTQDACLSCTQSGVITTDMGMIQGYSATCVTTQGGATQTSPTCSTCIAAVYACQLDM